MVFRLRPIMTAEGAEGTRRRTKFLLAFIVICVMVVAYYLFSFSRENQKLIRKQLELRLQLKKYAAAYGKCERNLKTSRSDVLNFQDSNKQLQARIVKSEKDLASSEKDTNDVSLKLDQAYQFFLDVKDLLSNDASIAVDKLVSPEAAVALKQEIEKFKSMQTDYEKMQASHTETTKALDELKRTHNDLVTRSTDLEAHARKLFKTNKKLNKELVAKKHMIEENTKEIEGLKGALRTLKERIKTKLSSLRPSINPEPKSVVATKKKEVPPPPPVTVKQTEAPKRVLEVKPAPVAPEKAEIEKRIVEEDHVVKKTPVVSKPVSKKPDTPSPASKPKINPLVPKAVPKEVPASPPSDEKPKETTVDNDAEEGEEEGEEEGGDDGDDGDMYV